MNKKRNKQLFSRVAIVGLGLMGGSLALALKKFGLAGSVAGFARRAATRRKALARGIVDSAGGRLGDVVRGAGLVVLCAPVSSIPVLARRCRAHLERGVLVTDVGSVKAHIVEESEKALRGTGAEFVGSHPIAGSDQQGLDSARADLYSGAVVVLTPSRNTSGRALRRIQRFWTALGARTVITTPARHDRIVARTSHLPHIISSLLAGCVGRSRALDLSLFCGPGFRDATRIAGGDPALWRDIIAHNLPAVKMELKRFEHALSDMAVRIERGPRYVQSVLKRGRDSRNRLLAIQTPRRTPVAR